jgi:hypothetical protein
MTDADRARLKLAYKSDLIKSIANRTADPTGHYRALGLTEADMEEVRNEVGNHLFG